MKKWAIKVWILKLPKMMQIGAVGIFMACAAQKSTTGVHEDSMDNGGPKTSVSKVQVEPAFSGKKLAEPGELDKLLDAKPLPLPVVKTSLSKGAQGQSKPVDPVPVSKGKFRIQIGAESDMDAAQSKKNLYEKQLGGNVDIIFDAPYYKMRWGYFDSKQEAEDKLLELSDQKIQGFVVK